MDVDAFRDHLVVCFRRDGLTACGSCGPTDRRTNSRSMSRSITVTPGGNPEYDSRLFRLGFVSLVTPDSVYDCDTATGELTLLKPPPGTRTARPRCLPCGGLRAAQGVGDGARTGRRVPISIVCRKGTPRDGSAPFLLYGYGSYEHLE